MWRVRGWYEMRQRTDGLRPKFYWTGDVGDVVGFTLIMVAWHWTVDLQLLLISAVPAALGTLCLHRMWQTTARVRGDIVSMYLPDGSITFGGGLHLVYVLFVVAVLCSLAWQLVTLQLTQTQIILLVGGSAIYLLTVAIDKYRGII